MSQTKAQLIEGLNINTSAPADALVIDSSGNVGIGTTSPINALHINGAANNVASRIRISSTEGSGLTLRAESATESMINVDSSENLLFGVGGSEVARIDSSGNVGIGITSPNRKLQVAGATAITNSGDTGAFLFDPAGSVNTLLSRAGQSSTTSLPLAVKIGNTERMRIDSSGRLLVGLTSDLSGGTSSTAIQIATTGGGFLGLARNDSTITAGNSIGGLRVYSNAPSGYNKIADLRCEADGTFAANDYPSRWVFTTTADGASSPTERMRIDSSGNVGIGTTSPAGTFDVSGNARIGAGSGGNFENAGTRLLVANTGGDAYIQIQAADSTGTSGLKFGRNSVANRAGIDWSASTDALQFRTGGNTERMRIDSSGNVGIGHNSPASLLTVGGDAITTAKPTVSIAPSSGNGSITIRGGSPTLSFDQTGGGDGTIIYDSSSELLFKNGTLDSSTERMRMDSSGRLLIGSTSSRTNAGIQPKFQVEGTGSDASLSLIRNTNNSANPYLLFAKSRGSSNGSNAIVQNNDYLGAIYFSGADGTDINSSAAEIHCRVDGTPGSNDMPGRLVFSTTGDGSHSPTERVHIDQSGNFKLRSGNQLLCQDANNHTSVQIGNIDSGSNSARISVDPDSTGSGSYLEFRVDNAEVYRAVNNFVRTSTLCNGLQFNGDTATANALNDYEEGTWTPVFGSTSGSFGSVTYATQTGTYTKIGNRVFIDVRLRKSAHSIGTAGGYLVITGLPFQVASSAGAGGGSPAISNFNFPDDVVNVSVEMRENTTQFYPALYTRDNATFSNLGPSTMNSGTAEVRATFSYYTNS